VSSVRTWYIPVIPWLEDAQSHADWVEQESQSVTQKL
jgi:hypothetical protein